ncbi:MICOS complex subunit MIC10 isoform X1 [Cygnus olor]|uniref:MICOS complex subunit MIC10 isoform X1 n=1 Tax=Cygnus olor TaxID=8869 RepID=UPI001ADE161D|nr:MICOS complex subunit MIC10 isoform X1 [Cygnus olor]
MFVWPPFTRGGRSRERHSEAEEEEARPEVGGDGQDGVGGRAGQEVGPVPGGLRRQAGVLARFSVCYVNSPHNGGDENESLEVLDSD